MKTQRAQLRRFTWGDLPFMEEMESDDEVMIYTSQGGRISSEKTKKRLGEIIDSEEKYHPFGVWAAVRREDQDLVGWFMLRHHRGEELELGYMIRKKYWGQGYATEVAGRLVEFGLHEMKEDFVSAITSPKNRASQRVLEKIGFKFIKNIEVEEHGSMVELNYFRATLKAKK